MLTAGAIPEPPGGSGPDVFEIVLPVTVLVLSDEDFLLGAAEEREVPGVEQGFKLNSSACLKSEAAPSSDSNCDGNDGVSDEGDGGKHSEEKGFAQGVCNSSESPLSAVCDADADKCGRNCVLPSLSCKTQITGVKETSEGKEGDGGFQEVPFCLSSAGSEGRDDTRPPTLAVVPKCEEEIAGVLPDGSPEKRPQIPEEMEAVAEMEDPDSSKNGDTEAGNRKVIKFEDETLSSFRGHDWKEEEKSTYNCSDPFFNGYSPTFEELLKDVEKPEVSASTSAESNTIGDHIYKTLTPFPRKRYRQRKAVSSHANPKEFQSQQEGLSWLSNSVTITPFSKTSCSTDKHEKLPFKCRFCSSVYKRSANLKKHIYSAHKDKKVHKCCFCKRTFFFSFNLKKHLKLHKKITQLQKARKTRINVRKGRQRESEEGTSGTKKRDNKYEKFFIKIERDFTPLSVPVSFSCRICFFASSNPRSFIHHMKGHKGRPPYQCPQCDYSCSSFSFLLNHLFWHAGYKLYQCRFCPFFSLYFGSMVRHSYIHTETKPYSCEFCHSTFTSSWALKRHRRLHAVREKCQGQQLNCGSGSKRTQRPVKNYPCDECNLVFYTKGHLGFHKKFHEQLKANGYTAQGSKYQKSKIHKGEGDSQGRASLYGREGNCLSGEGLASELDCEQAGDVRDMKKTCSEKEFPGSSSLAITWNRSEAPQNSYQVDTTIYKEEPLFKSKASRSQVQDDDAHHKFVEHLKDPRPSGLDAFKTYRCQHCSYSTDVHNNFRLHLKIHMDERPFVCKDCNKTFKTSNHLQKHSLLHIKNGQELGSCLYVERCLENLELHHEMHGGMCPETDFGFSEGSGSSLLASEVCGAQPGVPRGRKKDLLARSQPPFYQCAECTYTTYVLSNLELHIRTHTGEKPYSCSVCQMKFRTSSHLRRHRVTHFNMEHFKCRSCDYSTKHWLSLKQHLASHSGEGSSSAGCPYEHRELPVKTYTCEECGYCTAHNGNLKPHLRIHTGEKPFKCGQCALAFRTSSHLKRHLLTHSRLRCRRCKYSTLDKRALQKHLKTHTKKYTCGRCDVTLRTKKLLEKHKEQHKLGI